MMNTASLCRGQDAAQLCWAGTFLMRTAFPDSPPETTCLSFETVKHPCALAYGSRQGSFCLRGVASTSLHISANSLQSSAAVQHGSWWCGATVRECVCLCACAHEGWLGQERGGGKNLPACQSVCNMTVVQCLECRDVALEVSCRAPLMDLVASALIKGLPVFSLCRFNSG